MAHKSNLRTWLAISMFLLAIGLVSTAQAEPKYVIFLIGDGMGFEQVKAGGMYTNGQAGTLSFESFPYNGQLTTYSADSTVTDSAAAATALATGVKVNSGVVSMAYPGDGSELETLLEYSEEQDKSTGLVTTKHITDATPACFGAHEPSRMNFEQIADDYRLQTRPNVLLGGGANGMNDADFEDAGYIVITDNASMQALETENVSMVSGQFGIGPLPFEPDLGLLPHLSEMTATALSILDNDPDGFFLMVEGGIIDSACHANLIENAVLETVEFDNAVQVAIDWAAGRTDTLILVIADHETGGLTVLANNGAGVMPTVAWSTLTHTAANVPVYAWGVNAEMISGVMDNTDMFGVVTSSLASIPNPSNGAEDVPRDVVLIWKPTEFANTHDVYFGTNFSGVNDASRTNPLGVLVSQNQVHNNYNPAGVLQWEQTYYWRIDEVNAPPDSTIFKGDVWHFSTQEYLVVEDFEDYKDFEPDRIFDTWIDGWGVPENGSQVGYADPPFAEQTIVHGGKQSMPFSYENTTTASYSEATANVADLAIGQDWTKHGSIQTLVLYFYGSPGNTGQLYLKLNNSKVVYDGDAADIATLRWNQWNIDLASVGVNLQNVTKLSIGIDSIGASGILYFDDIRLYPLREP
ncbi:MAG: alkaline phosphatase [Phycisphaerae bacterium]